MANIPNDDHKQNGYRFPEIVLDITLAELLAEEGGQQGDEALYNFKPCANPDHKTVPVNKKFRITSSSVSDKDDLAHLQLENVSFLLSFWAGHMEVPMLNYRKANTRLRWGFALDFADQTPNVIGPELHYLLNSKRWLAECSLRSANHRIIDPECSCSDHTNQRGLWYFGSDCSTCKQAVEQEVTRQKEVLQNTDPPFVLKISQSLGSVGTMLVKNKEDRDKTVNEIADIQKESLSELTSDNAHIYPSSLVLSDFLPGDTNALNFWVRRDGSVRFINSCYQLSTRNTEGGRQHTALSWDDQEKLEKKYRKSLDDIGKVLHDKGYFGPCGADIMETEDGIQYVIDLNVRSSTSLILGLLRGHCDKRNFGVCGVYECLLISISRDDLETRFEKEFNEGRIILLGSTRLGNKDTWAYPVVLAGENQEAIKTLGAKLLKFDATGSSDAQEEGSA